MIKMVLPNKSQNMSDINMDIMINDTLNLETLALHLITEFDIKVSEYSSDDLNFYLENKFR